ncbi:ScbR family autoregulator-binding transcription factor [Actinomadura opuntiae]|uniref:ScbR family autoregulator-binding transcription factor n=1 Tax=Actinomadura sp. OS1-43 TaxID=604315 RepID=UPI00255A9EB6|nr:ScbR family autoregulator-binding transcription factor [Actinomadura sp. OS1-43]MDL4820288.1 ScbR family autoregulator-binding transcription factor [Actinomadura sp. OS1-43]
MQERARRTRRNIMEAAAASFEAHGYGAARLQDITDREDVSKGGLYFHFPSKESIALAIIRRSEELHAELVEELRPRFPQAMRLLIEYTHRVGRAFRDDVVARAGIRLLLESRLRDPSAPPPFSGRIDNVRTLLQAAREQGDLAPWVDPASAAPSLVAAFLGLQQIVMVRGGPVDPDRCVADMWQFLLPGLVPADRLAGLLALLPAAPGG